MNSQSYIKYLANNIANKLDNQEKNDLCEYLKEKINQFGLVLESQECDQKDFLSLVYILLANKFVKLEQESDLILSYLDTKSRLDLIIILRAFYLKNHSEISQAGRNLENSNLDLNANNIASSSIHKIKINGIDVDLFFKPYNFQINLAKNSCDNLNSLIICRTGSGKTLVASIICKYWYTKFKLENKLDKFKVAFIVPTRSLVEQQAKAFEKAFDSSSFQIIGEKHSESKIKMYFDETNILFLTHQKLINTINQGHLSIKNFTLLIFDECHHTNDSHPYNELMKLYYDEKLSKTKLPLIVGLTASQGIGKETSAIKHLIKLCVNLDCKTVSCLTDSTDLNELKHNIPSPLEDEIILVDHFDSFFKLDQIVNSLSCTIIANINPDLKQKVKLGVPEYENYLHTEKSRAEANHNVKMIISLKYLIELNLFFIRKEDFPINYCLDNLKSFYDEISKIKHPTEIELFCKNLFKSLIDILNKEIKSFENNAKLEKLVEIVLRCHQPNSRGLILVRTRHHTKALSDFLNENSRINQKSIKSSILIGKAMTENMSMNDNKQNEALDKFRNGDINLLVATDIAQEGLDVPECSYVIRYEFVSNEIGTVQSRGRARADRGRTFLITKRNSLNEKRERENRKNEDLMNKALDEFKKMDKKLFDKEFRALEEVLLKPKQLQKTTSFYLTSDSFAPFASNNSKIVKVHCRNCGEFLFNGDDLKHRDPCYICVCKKFIQEKTIADSSNKKFYCKTGSCKKDLGRLIEMRNSFPLYMIDIKGIKFSNGKRADYDVFSQWSQVRYYMDIQDFNNKLFI